MDKVHTKKVNQKYPWRGKFKTKQEIGHYFSGNKVQCLLCGKWFKTLPTHLKRTHDIFADEYRGKYGLPWKRGLCGKGVSLKLRKAMNERRKKGFLPDLDAAREKSKHATKRPDQPFFIKVKSEILKSGNLKRQKYRDEDYKNILTRMLKEKKTLNEVCKDNDLPGCKAVYKYAKKNGDFKKALDKTYEQLPYPVQSKAIRLPEKKFRKELKSLDQTGISVAEIARYLGVSKTLIRSRLKLLKEIPPLGNKLKESPAGNYRKPTPSDGIILDHNS